MSDPQAAGESLVQLEVGEGSVARLWLGGGAGATEPGVWLRALEGELEWAEALCAGGEVAAVVVQSRSALELVPARDAASLLGERDAAAGAARARAGQRVLRRLEELPVPTVAAVRGACLGAGLELALACSYRVAAPTPRTRLGLPEVRMGLIPGLGGSVRLPRLVGVQAGLRLILTGEPVDALEAARLGLVDEVITADAFDAEVERFARERVERGRLRARRRVPRRLLEDTAPGRALTFRRAAGWLPSAPHARHAARLALSTVAEGLALPLEEAFLLEADAFGELLASPGVQAVLHSTLLIQRAGRVQEPAGESPRRVAVLGAGEQGVELALVLARAGLAVRLRDEQRAAVAAGVRMLLDRLSAAEGGLRAAAQQGERDAEQRVAGGVGFGGFGTLEAVAAAVGDDPAATRGALLEVEEHTTEHCLLISSSPLVKVGELQQALAHPSRVAGLVLAHPAPLFPLAEVVAGPATSAATLDACRLLARQLGRIPIGIADRPGLLLGRLLASYFSEALQLLEDGAGVEQVDGAAEEFGLRMGPFRRMDAVGIPQAARLLAAAGDEAPFGTSLLDRLADAGEGFYRYRGGRPAVPNPTLPQGLPELHSAQLELIRDRLQLRVLNACARALDEEVVASAAEVEVACLLGLGYPRARGGPLYMADREGLSEVAARLQRLAGRFGERFAPAPLLRRLAEQEASFFGGGREAAGHAPPGVLT